VLEVYVEQISRLSKQLLYGREDPLLVPDQPISLITMLNWCLDEGKGSSVSAVYSYNSVYC